MQGEKSNGHVTAALLDPEGTAIRDLMGSRHVRQLYHEIWEVRSRMSDLWAHGLSYADRQFSLLSKYLDGFPTPILHPSDDPVVSDVNGGWVELEPHIYRIPADVDRESLFKMVSSSAWFSYPSVEVLRAGAKELESPKRLHELLRDYNIPILIYAFDDSDPWWIAVNSDWHPQPLTVH